MHKIVSNADGFNSEKLVHIVHKNEWPFPVVQSLILDLLKSTAFHPR